jgi:hypothetical protein
MTGTTARQRTVRYNRLFGPAWTDSRIIGLDHGWTAFSIRSESEIQPSNISALRSEAS